VQKGVDESQHSFEILLEAFVHAEQDAVTTVDDRIEKMEDLVATQKLPSGMDYPHCPLCNFLTLKIVALKM
jgi:hypothetical protein